jgi:hypothetical protein
LTAFPERSRGDLLGGLLGPLDQDSLLELGAGAARRMRQFIFEYRVQQ